MSDTRSALIVASYDYEDPGLQRLRAPAQDAEALSGVLRSPDIGGFDVRTMLNEPGHVISEAVEEFFADRSPNDLLLLYFSCHGVKDDDGELYFAAANTKTRRLAATAIAAEFVNRCMSRSRSRRVVLLLDCCYAGAFERGMVARGGSGVEIQERFEGRGRAVITATSAMEYAFEGDVLADSSNPGPSVFTRALVEGLQTGEADLDQDGQVGLDELYDYVYGRVREVTPKQTPGKWMFGVEGELYIARRGRPVTTPAPLPSELQQAVEHPLPSVRMAAVSELERLLTGGHAGRALAARLALERLSGDDSRTVSSAAEDVLARAGAPQSQPAEAVPTPAAPVPASSSPRVEPPAAPPRPDGRSLYRQPQWWLGSIALIALNLAVTWLITWWAIGLWNDFLQSLYVPGTELILLVTGILAAAWSAAYVTAEAAAGASSRGPWRRGALPSRLVATYRELLSPTGAGRFLQALLAAPPVNVLVLVAVSLGLGGASYQYLGGSSARDDAFILFCLLLNGLAMIAVFRPRQR